MTKFSAVIVAGGSGSRMGRPKQLIPLLGRPVLFRSIDAFVLCGAAEIIVAAPPEILAAAQAEFPFIIMADAAAERLGSVINGVKKARYDLVAVHDGARPLVAVQDILNTIARARATGAAVLGVKSKDTVKQVQNGVVVSTLDRNALYNAQTPQAYKTQILREALEKYGHEALATDESQLVEKLGVKVSIVEGSYKNIKITTPEDIMSAESFLGGYVERTGFGFDLHKLVDGRKFIIGGIEIPHTKGFLGHSDGDLVLHAVCDAALGAAALGEIGIFFPPTDDKIKGISSVKIAGDVIALLEKNGAQIAHIDATLITQEPKIKPHYDAVRASLNKIFNIGLENISFKSKSHEHVGEIGRGEAAMCQAVVTIRRQKK